MRNAASILLVFGGLTVASDLEELSRLAGTRRVERASFSSDGRARSSRSTHLVDEPVLSPAEVHALAPGEALCLWGRLPPVLAHLPALFEGRDAAAFASEEVEARAANDIAQAGRRPHDREEGTEKEEECP